jgi:hypothetical protein
MITIALCLLLLISYCSILYMESMCSSETSDSLRTTRRQNPESSIRQCIVLFRSRYGYGLNGLGSIPGRSKRFSSLQRPDRLWGPPSFLWKISPGVKRPGCEAHHLVPRSRRVELYLHSPMSSWLSAVFCCLLVDYIPLKTKAKLSQCLTN